MPTVYVRGDRTGARFHSTKECWQAQRRMPSGHQELREVDLADLKFARPCKTCHKDAPRAKSVHLRCTICNGPRVVACAHNGGIPVKQTRSHPRPWVVDEQVTSWERTIWVWPEDLRHHLVLPS